MFYIVHVNNIKQLKIILIMNTMNIAAIESTTGINTYDFNLNASTDPLFRFKYLMTQVESNKNNVTNPAIEIIFDEVLDVLRNAVDSLSDETNPRTYFFFAHKYAERLKTKRMFLTALLETMKTKHHDYPIIKYTISVLDEYYILGKDDLEDPE